VCEFITAGPSTKLFAWDGGGILEDMCYETERALERLRYYNPGH
jgi:hypothetical protein